MGKVEEYQREAYKELGFTDYQALKLMKIKGLDVGSVRSLIQKGCPVNIAYRIYRP